MCRIVARTAGTGIRRTLVARELRIDRSGRRFGYRESLAVRSVRASLVVLNYQGAAVIEQYVTSLAAAAGPDDEIIVVDNASTDGSPELLAARDDIRLLRLPENTYIFGLNDGLAEATGRYV